MCEQHEIAATKIDQLISAVDRLRQAFVVGGSIGAQPKASEFVAPTMHKLTTHHIEGDALVAIINRLNSDFSRMKVRVVIDSIGNDGVKLLVGPFTSD